MALAPKVIGLLNNHHPARVGKANPVWVLPYTAILFLEKTKNYAMLIS